MSSGPFTVKYFSQTTSLCIMRVARDHFRIAWGGLSFMNELDGIRVVPRVIGCSGQSQFPTSTMQLGRRFTAH